MQCRCVCRCHCLFVPWFCCCGCPWLTLSHWVPMKIFNVSQCFAEVGTMGSVGPMLFHLQTCVSSAPTQLSMLLDALPSTLGYLVSRHKEKNTVDLFRTIAKGPFLWVSWMDQHTHSTCSFLKRNGFTALVLDLTNFKQFEVWTWWSLI